MTIPVSEIRLDGKRDVALKTIPSDPESKITLRFDLFVVPTWRMGKNTLLSPADWFWAGSKSSITGLEMTEVGA
jgi:hypothetical protein